jgi:DNA-binding protein
MQGYEKVEKEKQKTEENEIRVTAKGQIKKQLGYAMRIFNATDFKTLQIRGTGNAIVKALILIELVKRRIGDLHQVNTITSTEIVDEYEPKIEGLEKIEQRRRVTCLECILSKEPLDETLHGYQPPTPKEERTERPP